jgi:hypothetical protein
MNGARWHSSNDTPGDDSITNNLALLPEVWEGIMEYLSFQTVLSCGAESRSILYDVMPLLTELWIEKSLQMNLAVASWFTVRLTSIDHPQIEGAYISGLRPANFIFLVCD